MKEMKTLTIGDVQYVIVDGSVGSLEELRTTIKTSIVAAINELVSSKGSINEEDLNAAINAALEEAKKNGEFDGPKGDTGVGILNVVQSTTSTADDGNNVITVTLTDGNTFTFTVQNGSKGSSGTNGKDGVDGKNGVDGEDGFSPIATVTQTATGATISITDVNGTTTAIVTNGKDGAKGEKGDTGATGPQGPAGADGEKGDKGDKGEQGIQGEPGAKGETGAKGDKGEKGDTGATGATGPAGYTPVKGVDYWTAADKSAMVSDVLAALPTWNGGSY